MIWTLVDFFVVVVVVVVVVVDAVVWMTKK